MYSTWSFILGKIKIGESDAELEQKEYFAEKLAVGLAAAKEISTD